MKKAFLVGIALTISLVMVLAGCADNNNRSNYTPSVRNVCTDGSGDTVRVFLGDGDYSGKNCSGIAHTSAGRQVASDGNRGTITDIEAASNADCNGTATCINSVYPGTWGGFFYEATGDIDLTASGLKLFVTYKLDSGGVLNVKLEDSDSVTEVDSKATMRISGATADSTWRTVEITVASTWTDASGDDGVDLSKVDKIGFWNQGANINLTIDEVFFE